MHLDGRSGMSALSFYRERGKEGKEKLERREGRPPLVFAGIILLAAGGGVRMLLHGGVSCGKRIARHLWRIALSFFIATGSFFRGQQKVFPAEWRGAAIWRVPGFFPWRCGLAGWRECGLRNMAGGRKLPNRDRQTLRSQNLMGKVWCGREDLNLHGYYPTRS
jgi:hypothetical protein